MKNKASSEYSSMLFERALPDESFKIEELLKLEYGIFEPELKECTCSIESKDEAFCAGKATLQELLCNVELVNSSFSFPFTLLLPSAITKPPVFLYMSFSSSIPDRFFPAEEIIDGGFAIASFDYQKISGDDDDFSSLLFENQEERTYGKLAVWSWAARRVMDYLETLPSINTQQVAVVGHSRLGKTALITVAYDKRFAAVISNESGCAGAALHRGKIGERIEDICKSFPYWFPSDFSRCAYREAQLPFDQHQLLSSIAPRLCYVSSAVDDKWADPISEFLACLAASKKYEEQGFPGLIIPKHIFDEGFVSHEGKIGYHMRRGSHYLSRYDWLMFMSFLRTHWNLDAQKLY